MTVHFCNSECCSYLVEPYENVVEIPRQIRRRKAGAFIYDKKKNKLLLVQSRGQLWGMPKGSFEVNEISTECAVREVKEETGIDIDINRYTPCFCLNNTSYYYYVSKEETIVDVQHVKDNDANGIGWFNLDCLKELCNDKKLRVNKHTILAIKKFIF